MAKYSGLRGPAEAFLRRKTMTALRTGPAQNSWDARFTLDSDGGEPTLKIRAARGTQNQEVRARTGSRTTASLKTPSLMFFKPADRIKNGIAIATGTAAM